MREGCVLALSLVRQGIETESLIGSEDTQVLLRAEAMVSGAGREAVKILMADAYLALGAVEVQADRVVLDGTVYAQAAYRLGDEASVRALTAQTTLNHAVDMDGAMAKMIARAEGVVEHVDASYENGHMNLSHCCPAAREGAESFASGSDQPDFWAITEWR